MATTLKVLARDTSGRATRAQVARDAGIKVGDVRLTAEGYMIAENVPVARIGVQEYSALELGLDASMKTIRLYRSPEAVFSAASMATLDRKPITYYHPERGVDASNWKAVSVGRVEAPAQDGDFLNVGRFEVNDGGTVEAIAFGVKEVSCGYSFTLDMKAGTTPSGESYDGLMLQIEHNHVAVVYQGRCGAGCAIGDCGCSSPRPNNDNHTENTMKIDIGGISIDIDDKVGQTVKSAHDNAVKALTESGAAATKRATDAETALAVQGEAMKKLATDSAKELAAAKAQILTPEQRQAEVAEIAKVTADAKLVAPDFASDGKSASDIRVGVLDHVLANDEARKPVVAAMLGGKEPAKTDAAIVTGAFDAVVALRGTTTTSGADGDYERTLRDAIGGKGKGRGAKEWTGEELYRYRSEHGGKNPPNFAA